MTANYTLADTSKVWIYQSSRAFTIDEAVEIQNQINAFCNQWVSHNNQLASQGKLVHHRFIVLMVDESKAGASGCSIDSSVNFIKMIGARFKIDLFDRMNFAYQQDGEIKTAHREEFAELYKNQIINDDTLVFDNLVSNKLAFDNQWIKPLKNSWHSRLV
jgi:hypothetical protein